MNVQRLDFDAPSAAHDELLRAERLAGLSGPLFVAGRLELLAQPMVSFGGGREAPAPSLAAIEHLAGLVTRAGGLVVSGGARGTDVAAHRGALKAGGGTVLIPACPIEDIEPTAWRPELWPVWDAQRMLFVSPFAGGRAVQRGFPLMRNRLSAALAGAAVAGHTALRGGTNHFIGEVMQLGAPLFMLDQPMPDDARLRVALDRLHRRGTRFFSAGEARMETLAIEIVEAARGYLRRRPMPEAGQMSLFEPTAEYTVI